jgi:hypothetical protein
MHAARFSHSHINLLRLAWMVHVDVQSVGILQLHLQDCCTGLDRLVSVC